MAAERAGQVSVLMGGTAAERLVSLKTGRAVLEALRAAGIAAQGVTLDRDDLDDLPAGTRAAFLALHGGFGEDGRIQAELEARGIAYTGSGPKASRLAMDKIASRRRLLDAGLALPAAVAVAPGATPGLLLNALGLPCVVKPRSEGSSLGVSIVRTAGELLPALEAAWEFGRTALVERFESGTELTVGILEGEPLAPVEVLPSDEFFTYDAKYGGPTTYLIDPPLPTVVGRAVREAAVAAYHALGCRHYGRVDMIVRPTGVPVVLEVNTLPGFTNTSLFPMAAEAAGIAFPDLCRRLLDLALADTRSAREAA